MSGLHWQARIERLDGLDIDERALRAAREELGTDTIKDTVNRALRQAGGHNGVSVRERLDLLAGADLARREEAWR